MFYLIFLGLGAYIFTNIKIEGNVKNLLLGVTRPNAGLSSATASILA